jgi:hypothetical protein
MDEARDHAEGARLLLGVVEDAAPGEEADFLIVVDLEGAGGDAGFAHRLHVVPPFVDALVGQLPIGRPGVVGGVDVGGQPFLEAVELVRPDEMHLARQAGAVAGGAEIMREGRNRGGELAGVVIGRDARDQLARHEAEPRGRAERRVAIGRVETRAARRQPVHMRGFHERVAVGAGEMRRELIGHDQHDVRRRGGHVRRPP